MGLQYIAAFCNILQIRKCVWNMLNQSQSRKRIEIRTQIKHLLYCKCNNLTQNMVLQYGSYHGLQSKMSIYCNTTICFPTPGHGMTWHYVAPCDIFYITIYIFKYLWILLFFYIITYSLICIPFNVGIVLMTSTNQILKPNSNWCCYQYISVM